MKSWISLSLMLAVALAGCQETPAPEMDGSTEEDGGMDAVVADAADGSTDLDATDADAADPDGTVVLGPTCTQTIPAGAANQRLCDLAGPVQHVRLDNVSAPPFHASAQVFIGLSAPTGSQTPLTAGQFKLQIYGGMGTSPAAAITPYFGAEGEDIPGDHMFVRTATSVCFDIHDGSDTTRAAFVLWRDDTNGADCHDRATLTLANAYAVQHAQANGAIIKDASQYYYQAGSVTTSPTVTLFDTLAVPDVPQPRPASCSTDIATTATTRVTELCEIEGTVQHVRIAGLVAAPMHASAQVLVGWDSPPASDGAPTSALTADQWKLQLYGGGPTGPGMSQAPSVDAFFGEHDENLSGDATYLHAASTICFDLHDGSATTPPYFVLWRDGVNGADCEDMATLTLATASGMELSYAGASGAIDKSSPLYFYQTTHTATPTVTIFNEPALTAAEAAVGLSCSTTWTSDAFWQPLCQPAAGRTRHFRIEDVTSQTPSKYLYVLLNEQAAPGPGSTPVPPAAGDGRFLFTGGWSHAMTSATWMRFNGGAQTPAAYETNGVPLYSAPHDVCVDLTTAPASTSLRVLLWSTGANGASCEDFSTLTAANALYDSTTSVADTFYTAPLGTTGTNYVKISGSDTLGAASLVRVVSFSEPVVR